MQLKYSNYVAFSHDYGFAVNNSGLRQQGRKKGEIGRKKATTGIIL